MADDTPEAIRERVHAEELAKGSDPRVALGRAKAAELRAREGLPIDPEQAWRAKLEKEGGAAPAAAEAAAPAAPEAEEAAAEPEPAPAEPAPAEAAPAEEEQAPAPEPAESPAPVEPAPAAPTPAEPEPGQPAPAQAVTPAAPAPAEPARPPELGEPIVVPGEGLEEIAGIRIRDPRAPAWLMILLAAMVLWAGAYLLFFSGSEAISNITGCRVGGDGVLVCFQEAEPEAEAEAEVLPQE